MKKRTKRVFVSDPTPSKVDFAYLKRTSLPTDVALDVERLSQKMTLRGIRRAVRKAVESGQHPELSRYVS
jgi:hypothetical protein